MKFRRRRDDDTSGDTAGTDGVDLSRSTWNWDLHEYDFAPDSEKYRSTVLDQYKLYVEMADRASARRSLTNGFFLTLNVAVLTTLVATIPRQGFSSKWLIFPLLVLLIECLAWFMLMKSYRLLNSAKYQVVAAMEKALPARPYSAEWDLVLSRSGSKRYWRLTLLEQWIPSAFAALYVLGFALDIALRD